MTYRSLLLSYSNRHSVLPSNYSSRGSVETLSQFFHVLLCCRDSFNVHLLAFADLWKTCQMLRQWVFFHDTTVPYYTSYCMRRMLKCSPQVSGVAITQCYYFGNVTTLSHKSLWAGYMQSTGNKPHSHMQGS